MDRPAHIDWDDLNVLLALSAEGSTARAGRRLGLSHQTVARRLARLETRLGGTLIDRGATPWQPTEIGRAVAGKAAQMASLVASALALTRPESAGFQGKVSIAGPRWLITLAVLPALSALRLPHPRLTFDLLSETAPADITLVMSRAMPPLPGARCLADLGLSLYGRPDAIARMEAALAAGLPVQDFTQTRPHLLSFDAAATDANVTTVRDFDTLVDAVRQGLGTAVLPEIVGRTLPGIVASSAIPLPRGSLALWCVIDPDSENLKTLRAVEREILRACRPQMRAAA
ncbi:LysR family transcriptional regulator [Seohaeicola nanhaiensis]|uniref:LysR family transcriptional regulator n=1 Tax=Seohaeicola nanhaiensis TaxID=1387282 RepID=A0ABV9KF10_9RHOB